MIIAQGHDLEQQFGANTLFKNVNFSIDSNARIGLVGPNGVGKTTLLKIMTGEQEPTHGEFTVNKGIDVGYIAQENALDENKTIWDEMETVFAPLIRERKSLVQLQEKLQIILKIKNCLSNTIKSNSTLNKKAVILINLILKVS